MTTRIRKQLAMACLFTAVTGLAMAEVVPDRLKVMLGGYKVQRYDTQVAWNSPGIIGVTIDLGKDLGVSAESVVLRFDGYYRFTPEHRIEFGWLSINSSGSRNVTGEIPWPPDDPIPVGTRVDSYLDTDTYRVGYAWSFYHNEKVELSLAAGLHITQVSVGIRAEVTGGGTVGSGAEALEVTAPLPVVGYRVSYNVNPRLKVMLLSDVFSMNYSDTSGTYQDMSILAEYRVIHNMSIGGGFNYNVLNVTSNADDGTSLSFKNTVSGFMLYLAAGF